MEVKDTGSSYGGYNYGGRNAASKFDTRDPFDSVYETPGWQRAQKQNKARAHDRGPTIEGELVVRSGSINTSSSSFKQGDKALHLKFGEGIVASVDGNKLTIDFPSVGRKKVLESFIKRP